MEGWERGGSRLVDLIAEQTERCLEVYAKDPKRVQEDANGERRISEGGYHDRQLEELVQNAVDAARQSGSRIEVVLTRTTLYVANDGEPFTEEGLLSIMASDLSTKDDVKVGRFGIGFKSVLAVSDSPKIFSRSVSFGFDRSWSEEMLGREGFVAERYPVMRLAQFLDPHAAARQDDELRTLMTWASTVIVIPLRLPADSLASRLNGFSGEFVLFSPHISRAVLRNRTQAPTLTRAIGAERMASGLTRLTIGSTSTAWKVVTSSHRPSPRALADGGYSAERNEIAVSYAVQVPPSSKSGRFWAYFPTGDETTLSGVVNAPWKLSEDRLRVLPGMFNEEILRGVVPHLVAEALAAFDAVRNPGQILDLLPARGREARSDADLILSGQNDSSIFDHLRTVPSLPDGTGTLRTPSEVKWAGDLRPAWLELWAGSKRAPLGDWLHPGLNLTPERGLKIRRLLNVSGEDGDGNATVAQWLEALVEDGSVEASAEAIHLAATIADQEGDIYDEALRRRIWTGLHDARIVRFEDGTFGAARRGKVFVRVEGDTRDDVSFVDPALASMPDVKEDLKKLGVVVMDRSGELRALIARAKLPEGLREPDTVWPTIWSTLRDLPPETALSILREDLGRQLERIIKVRTASGKWTTPGNAFLGGAIVPIDGSRDRDFLIDPVFHREDDGLLRETGAVEAPAVRHNMPREVYLGVYEDAMKERFIYKDPNGRDRSGPRPSRERVELDGPKPAWPLQPLTKMSVEARTAATVHLLAMGLPTPWSVQHATQTQYGKCTVIAPEVWFIRKYGLLPTVFGALPPHEVLQATDAIDTEVLPAFEATDSVARAIGLKTSVDSLASSDWAKLKSVVDQWTHTDGDDARRTEFYSWLTDRITPKTLVVRVGSRRQAVALENIGVTKDRSVYGSMIEAQVPALFTESEEDFARFTDPDDWGLPFGTDLLQEEIVPSQTGEAEYLCDLFPPLKVRLATEAPDAMDARIQPCTRLVKMLATPQGQRAIPIDFHRDGDVVFVTATKPREVLTQAAAALNLVLDPHDITKIFTEMETTATNKLRHAIKSACDNDERLIKAVGVEALRRIVPAQALEALAAGGPLADKDIAGLARAVHGVGILKQLKSSLAEAGLAPPTAWTGQRLARAWATSLGFPSDWAGFSGANRPPVEVIDGPVELGELHPYQTVVTHNITSLLRRIGPDRGMVSLPTGAGKTRVTVQALVDGVGAGDISLENPLLWIAQTDELCEQAAETWTEVWRARGPHLPMRLGRLWSTNEVDEEPGPFQLIVATIDKLSAIVQREDSAYVWLQTPSVVVIDEAHTSVAKSYTEVLQWLGRSARRRHHEDRQPLIGLTATPFRGNSEYETERLVHRYANNRLDRGAFRNDDDSYGELQSMGVLAKVRHELIDGVEIELSKEELARMTEFGGRLPTGVETRLGERLERTWRIVDHIAKQPDDWTMLAFTPSVENARVLAALLSHRGISAVSISADTDAAARRYYVEEFKRGHIQVITNYNILTQGFDAPMVRAVYVTRPTFSPNVYQQMVGRGLRGPKNGGLDEVLIVNVKDNFHNYGEKLAFTEFEYLWSRG